MGGRDGVHSADMNGLPVHAADEDPWNHAVLTPASAPPRGSCPRRGHWRLPPTTWCASRAASLTPTGQALPVSMPGGCGCSPDRRAAFWVFHRVRSRT